MQRLFLTAFLGVVLSLELLHADAHIFVLHRFDDARHASTSTSTQTLRSYFEYLKTHHYEVVSLSTLRDALLQHKKIPDNWVLFTIDDSYKSFYTNALELFKTYHYPFTLFVYAEASKEHYGDFMSFSQIKEAMKYGEVGLHSYSHQHLVSLAPEAVYRDTKRGLELLEDELNTSITYYAYPYGEYDRYVQKEIERFNFSLILNQNSGAVSAFSDPHDVDRIALTGKSVLKPKLRLKHLRIEWLTPKGWPLNGKLKLIHAKISPEIDNVEYYISGGRWQKAKVHDGVVRLKPDLVLKNRRVRIFLKHNNHIGSMILVKE